MRYLDNELDTEEMILFDEHQKECPLCASFVERSRALDELLERTLAPSGDSTQSAAFVNRILDRVDHAGSERDARAGLETAPALSLARKLWPLAAAVAAAVLLLWAFTMTRQEGDSEQTPPDPLLAEAIDSAGETDSTSPLRLPASPVSDAMRRKAYGELSAVLARLDAGPDEELVRSFEEETHSLSEGNWRVDMMLIGALRREKGPALRSAIRLVGHLAHAKGLPDASHSLERLINDGPHASDAMAALCALGTERATAALGKLLGHQTHRRRALSLLTSMNSKNAAGEIAARVQSEEEYGALSDFGAACARALSRMGEPGAMGLVESCARSGAGHGFARALAPPTDEFAALLVGILPSLDGTELMAGLGLASALRIDGAVDVLQARFRERVVRKEAPHLAAAIGGPGAARLLVDLYQGPVSLRERRDLNAALAALFEHYPDELDETMAALLGEFQQEDCEVLIEMLSQARSRGACQALAWIVATSPHLAPDAALSLARSGSGAALEELLRLLNDLRLCREARVAAAAAAFHIAGPSILDQVKKSLEADQGSVSDNRTAFAGGVSAVKRSRLTQIGFRKLQNYISRQTE